MVHEESLVTLTTTEQQALDQHEAIIARGLQTFYEVGNALATIRDRRLYRKSHAAFEDYCQERWGMGRVYANRIIAASETVDNLMPMGIMLPGSERQIRSIASLPPGEQPAVWQHAVETAPNGKVTAAHVARCVQEHKQSDPVTTPHAYLEQLNAESDHADRAGWLIADPETLLPTGEKTVPQVPHAVHYSSESPEWYTPKHIIARAVSLFGSIDLDPCSNSKTAPNVPAREHFTQADDGLSHPWWGKVYMNSPYGDEISPWITYLIQQYEGGNIDAAIALIPARPDTQWFQPLFDYPLCFVKGRLKFSGADTSAPFPSVIVYMGLDVEGFKRIFGDIGRVGTLL